VEIEYVSIGRMVPNPAAYYIVVGSRQEQSYSPKHIEKELLKAGVLKSLSEIDINNSMDVLSWYFLDRLKAIMEGLSILPDNPSLLYARAQAEDKLLGAGRRLILDERSPDAVGLSRSISQVYAKSGIPWLIMSEVLSAGGGPGDMQQALFCAQQAVKAAPQNVEARRNLGALLTGLFIPLFGELCEVGEVNNAVCRDVCRNAFCRADPKPPLSQSRHIRIINSSIDDQVGRGTGELH